MKRVGLALLFVAASWMAGSAEASGLISSSDAARFGLSRPWFYQVEVDAARGKLQGLVLDEDVLFTQTDQGKLDAVNATTGERLWTTQVGASSRITSTPAVSHKFVAAINGSVLYVLNRVTGKILWSVSLPGAPGAGPCLSQQRVYVPLVSGRVLAYRLAPAADPLAELKKAAESGDTKAASADPRTALRLSLDKAPPVSVVSAGRVLSTPILLFEDTSVEIVAWTTDRGLLCVGKILRSGVDKSFELLYSVRTDKPIVSSPAYLPSADREASVASGLIFAGSQDGYLYAIRGSDGEVRWRFPTGSPINESPVVLGSSVFVSNDAGNLYCVGALDGVEKWSGPIPNVTRFLTASRSRLYVTDPTGQVVVIDARRGAAVDRIPLETNPLKLTNLESDRLIVASPSGVVQCLHESNEPKPLVRRYAAAQDPDLAPPDPAKTKKVEPSSATAPQLSTAGGGGSSTPRASKKSSKKDGGISSGGPLEAAPGKQPKGGKRGRGGMPGGGMPGMPAAPGAKR